ncbi:hypothetical protein K503DRAFT_574857 [Rhizopogon vinicolor AM-OR11-026]|uniref:Uncharacterized protein n=1 Tax=Rhizopogon vinicolor AM-OR11-026 TaxID=1314800 RepID=A0A1B7N7F3_9AGAM|nr:hypothetical protein K503DRAFT_574857 [Rhizopogon vinicolor AM-OR11-026]
MLFLVQTGIPLLTSLLFMVAHIRRRLSRSRLLFHFFSGSRVLHCCSSSGTRAYRTSAVGFSSETDMVGYVLDVLLNSDSRVLCMEYLLICVRLLGLVQEPPLTRVRKYFYDQLLWY